MMSSTRRAFLTASSSSLLGLAGLEAAGARRASAQAAALEARTTICPYCTLGCGALVLLDQGRIRRIEGDPQHPISGGALCAKGASMVQIANSTRRVTTVKYRAPGAAAWEDKDWDWALAQIAARIQHARDTTFQATDPAGQPVNRTRAIGSLGGAALNNEECYALSKLARALGLVFLDHEARDGHTATLAAFCATFGYAAITRPWNDLAKADVILALRCNVAENHPVAMKWLTAAQQHGAALIVVEPRLTRTAAVADQFVPLRAGSELAFVGGLIRQTLDQDLVDKPYLAAHTNAGYLVDPAYTFEAGRFGPIENGAYTKTHWQFQRDAEGNVRQDPSLDDPNCVFQHLKRHFARYTWTTVSEICGTPVEQLRRAAGSFLSTGQPDRAGAIVYAGGFTQHSHGTQNVRSAAILQLLLGNMGVAGGGLYALGGQSNEQGACEHGLLHEWLPGYLAAPTTNVKTIGAARPGAEEALKSLLNAWWGERAGTGNPPVFHYLPKHDGDGSQEALFSAIEQGEVQGLLVWEQNPAVGRPDLERCRRALEKLRWLVVTDLWETETANFWKRPGAVADKIDTEVFLLPAAAWLEKEGTLTSAGRRVQRRAAVTQPPGECRSELWILDRLCRELKRRYAAGGVFVEPIVELAWDYGDAPSAERVAEEIPTPRQPAERACLFAPSLDDGPLPEHYEPLESPVANLLSPQQHSPLVMLPRDQLGTAEAYPIVATTFGVAEHWQTGSTTRNVPWLVELVPNAFAELSRELARQKGIATGDLITIRSARGQITLHALVTGRLQPLKVAGRWVEQIAILDQFGHEGLATGPSAHVLTSRARDPVSKTPEAKAFLCDVCRAQR